MPQGDRADSEGRASRPGEPEGGSDARLGEDASPYQEVEFTSQGVTCRGSYFAPDDASVNAPCVVLGPGFGGTIQARLVAFAERYAAAGFHAIAFDYRHFGASDGEPRQLLSIRRQLEDWHAAVGYARGLPGVDANRIALMGTSFSGGHVVRVAAKDQKVSAVIAQCPMMDGWVALMNVARYAGWGYLARVAGFGMRDGLRAIMGREPLRVPIVGPPGSLAAMTTPDAEPGYMAIAPPDFRNEVCARIGLQVSAYRPVGVAQKLSCPILIQICEHDSVAPITAAEAVAKKVGSLATVVRYPVGHFDVYLGEAFERSVQDQVQFLARVFR